MSHGTGAWVSGKQADLFFTAGRIDSLYLYDWAWWGISSMKQVDYIQRKRRYMIYNEQSLPVHIVECDILGFEPERLIRMEGHLFALEKTTLDPTMTVTTLTYDPEGNEIERQTQTYLRSLIPFDLGWVVGNQDSAIG